MIRFEFGWSESEVTSGRVQYARTADGVNVAYGNFGEGPPVVMTSNIWSNLSLGLPQLSDLVESLTSQGRCVLTYDGRGMGLSDREGPDFSLPARLLDLEAVLAVTGLDKFVLFGRDHGAPTAIAYAVEHPERVPQLVLIEAYLSGSAFYGTVPALRALNSMRAMADDQWELFLQTLASIITGFDDAEHARKTADIFGRA